MDTAAIVAGVSCGLAVLVPLAGFAMHMERRLTRLETLIEALTNPAANAYRWGRQA